MRPRSKCEREKFVDVYCLTIRCVHKKQEYVNWASCKYIKASVYLNCIDWALQSNVHVKEWLHIINTISSLQNWGYWILDFHKSNIVHAMVITITTNKHERPQRYLKLWLLSTASTLGSHNSALETILFTEHMFSLFKWGG